MPNSIANVGFSDYSAEQANIERRRQMAQALTQQADKPLETQTAGGWAIPISHTQGLAKMFQAYQGASDEKKATEEQKKLGQRYQSDLANTLMQAQRAGSGTPAGQMEGTELSPGFQTPAVAPDRQAMARILMGHPGTQQLGMQQMAGDMQMQSFMAAAQPQGQPGTTQMPQQATGGVQAQGQPQGFGGPAGGVPMAVWLQADKTGAKYLEQLAKDSVPIPVGEGGALYGRGGNMVAARPKLGENVLPEMDAQGRVIGVKPMPGAAEAAAGQAGAVEAAKAGFDLVDVPMPGGGSQKMTRAAAAQMLGGGTQTAQNKGPLPANVPPEDASAFKYVQDQAQRGLGAKAYGNSQYTGTQGMGVTPGEGEKKTDTVIGEGLGKRYNEIQDAGFASNAKMNKYTRLGGLMENLNTGKLAPAGFELAAYAKELGLPVGEKLDNAQAAKAIANEMALELRNPAGGAGMPGAMSDADREYLRSMIAGLDKTPGANKMLIEGMTKMAEREREISRLAREYKRKNGGRFDDGFYDELQAYSQANPMFKGKTPASTDTSGTLSQEEQSELQQLRARFGKR